MSCSSGNADFRRLWTGQVVSEIGDWLNNIAVLALAIQLAGAGSVGLAVATYAIARHLPLFLFGPVAGVVVDRVSRRRVMIAADVARAALALGFMLANRAGSLALIYVVGASLFSVSAFFNAAKRASIPNLVNGTEELLAANSLSASTTAATIAVGSALGGRRRHRPRARHGLRPQRPDLPRLGRDDSQNPQARQQRAREPRASKSTTRPSSTSNTTAAALAAQRLLQGLSRRVALREARPVLAAVFVVAGGWGLGNGAARALYSLFGAALGVQAAARWGASVSAVAERPTDFGISVLFVAMGLGGVLGAPLARRFNSGAVEGLGARMGRSLTLDGCGLLLFSLTPNLFGAAALLVAREMNFAIWWTAQQTLLMRRTEDAFAGRVFASYETLTTLTMVGSMLVSGAAADRLGMRAVAAGGGAVIMLSGLLWFVLRRRREETA